MRKMGKLYIKPLAVMIEAEIDTPMLQVSQGGTNVNVDNATGVDGTGNPDISKDNTQEDPAKHTTSWFNDEDSDW